jgi:hypothetical protein
MYVFVSNSVDVVEGAGRKAKRMVLQCINGVGSNPVEGRTKKFTALKSNSNTVCINFQTYIIFIINLVSLITFRSSGTDILYGCHLLDHPTTSTPLKRSFINRSVTCSRKANLGIDVRHVYKRV